MAHAIASFTPPPPPRGGGLLHHRGARGALPEGPMMDTSPVPAAVPMPYYQEIRCDEEVSGH